MLKGKIAITCSVHSVFNYNLLFFFTQKLVMAVRSQLRSLAHFLAD